LRVERERGRHGGRMGWREGGGERLRERDNEREREREREKAERGRERERERREREREREREISVQEMSETDGETADPDGVGEERD
jgi:hypothetical protein